MKGQLTKQEKEALRKRAKIAVLDGIDVSRPKLSKQQKARLRERARAHQLLLKGYDEDDNYLAPKPAADSESTGQEDEEKSATLSREGAPAKYEYVQRDSKSEVRPNNPEENDGNVTKAHLKCAVGLLLLSLLMQTAVLLFSLAPRSPIIVPEGIKCHQKLLISEEDFEAEGSELSWNGKTRRMEHSYSHFLTHQGQIMQTFRMPKAGGFAANSIHLEFVLLRSEDWESGTYSIVVGGIEIVMGNIWSSEIWYLDRNVDGVIWSSILLESYGNHVKYLVQIEILWHKIQTGDLQIGLAAKINSGWIGLDDFRLSLTCECFSSSNR
jgi:hypothetical protein